MPDEEFKRLVEELYPCSQQILTAIHSADAAQLSYLLEIREKLFQALDQLPLEDISPEAVAVIQKQWDEIHALEPEIQVRLKGLQGSIEHQLRQIQETRHRLSPYKLNMDLDQDHTHSSQA